MSTFEIKQRGKIEGIPSIGPNRVFSPGDIYTSNNSGELQILSSRPDYVATLMPDSDDGVKPGGLEDVAVIDNEDQEPVHQEPSELDIAKEKQAFKDELLTTSQRQLFGRTFPDGSEYKTVYKYAMKKVEFVDNILNELARQENDA